MIIIACPSCRTALSIPDHYAGQTGRCTHCGATLAVPIPLAPTTGARRRIGRLLAITATVLAAVIAAAALWRNPTPEPDQAAADTTRSAGILPANLGPQPLAQPLPGAFPDPSLLEPAPAQAGVPFVLPVPSELPPPAPNYILELARAHDWRTEPDSPAYRDFEVLFIEARRLFPDDTDQQIHAAVLMIHNGLVAYYPGLTLPHSFHALLEAAPEALILAKATAASAQVTADGIDGPSRAQADVAGLEVSILTTTYSAHSVARKVITDALARLQAAEANRQQAIAQFLAESDAQIRRNNAAAKQQGAATNAGQRAGLVGTVGQRAQTQGLLDATYNATQSRSR